MSEILTLTTANGYRLFAEFTPAKRKLRGAIHLVPGMGEHQGRYATVRAVLNEAGFAVLAQDHRGHGKTADLNGDPLGHMTAGGATWESWVSDLGLARQALLDRVGQGTALILLGHSMGSFFAQRTVQMHADWYAGLILSGSTGRPTVKQNLASWIPRLEARLRGWDKPCKTFHELTFHDFNRAFRGDRHRQAWLSRDPAVWAAYVADPYCDHVVYCGGHVELGKMIRANFTEAGLGALKADKPTLFFGGTCDALSDRGRGLERLADEWRRHGVKDLTLKLWEGGRHECLNETNRHDVIAHVVDWLKERF